MTRETNLAWQDLVTAGLTGQCPFCNRGGFKKLGQHIAMKHMTMAELRSQFGLSETQALCSEEYSEEARQRALRSGSGQWLPVGKRKIPRPGIRLREQTRAAMSGVAVRPEVKERLVARNQDPAQKKRRFEGMRRSPSVADSMARASAILRRQKLTRRWRTCSICGVAFSSVPWMRQRRTCSPECRQEAWVLVGRANQVNLRWKTIPASSRRNGGDQ